MNRIDRAVVLHIRLHSHTSQVVLWELYRHNDVESLRFTWIIIERDYTRHESSEGPIVLQSFSAERQAMATNSLFLSKVQDERKKDILGGEASKTMYDGFSFANSFVPIYLSHYR